jgi:hypothetical protein
MENLMNLHNKYKTGDNNSFTYIYYNNIHEIRKVTIGASNADVRKRSWLIRYSVLNVN